MLVLSTDPWREFFFISFYIKPLFKPWSPFRETLIISEAECTITTSKENNQLKQTRENTQR